MIAPLSTVDANSVKLDRQSPLPKCSAIAKAVATELKWLEALPTAKSKRGCDDLQRLKDLICNCVTLLNQSYRDCR